MRRRVWVSLIFSALTAIAEVPAVAGTFTFTGNFPTDDSRLLVSFSLASAATVTMQTWSYGGGTLPGPVTVPAGGFAPVISFFDSSADPILLGSDNSGGTAPSACGPRNIDAATGLCLDASLVEGAGGPLSAGSYFLILTEQDNTANGPNLSDGFTMDGTGNFTGPEHGIPGGSFLDRGGFQRTNSYYLTISGVDQASVPSAVPEPSMMGLCAAGLSVWAGLKIRRTK